MEVVLPVLVLAASLINRFTEHHSHYRGVSAFLLGLAERLSLLKSKGVSGFPAKLPLSDVPPVYRE